MAQGRLDMRKFCRLLRKPGFHILAFVLFLLVSIWPILSISGKSRLPNFFVYLFSVWAVMILALFLLSQRLRSTAADDGENEHEAGGQRRV
jgi:hypothetical protein